MSIATLFADIARELHSDDDPQATLQRVVDLAVASVPGAEHAAITTMSGLEFTTVATTDDLPMRVDQVQYETREGPCVDSLLRHEVHQANDLATDTRFPLFAREAVRRTGVRSMLSFRLFTEDGSLGALNMYAMVPDAFSSASVAMGAVFAAHASVAVRSARTAEARDELRDALSEGRDVSVAVGIVIAATGCSDEEARSVLEAAARDRRVAVHEVAEQVLESRQPPADTETEEATTGAGPRSREGASANHHWPRDEAKVLLAGLTGLGLALALVGAFSSSPTQRPLAVLLIPVLAIALVASWVSTAAVALLAVAAGGAMFATGDPASGDLRLRFAALLVGAALAVVFAVVRERREGELSEQVAAVAVGRARAETESILTVMLSRLPELDAAPDVEGVARRACPMARDLFGADHVSYWQVEGPDCVLVCRDPGGGIPSGTRVPRHVFVSNSAGQERNRTTWVRAAEVSVPEEGAVVARAVNAEVGASTPIQVAGQTVAYLGMSWTHGRAEPDRSWLDAVDRFADQIALSKTVIRRRLAQRETLSLAQRFQAGMLPPIPDQDLLTVRTLYRPGHQQMLLGGDFLDVLTEAQDTISFILGDVSGHGPEQAALGATLRGAWLSLASIPALGPRDWALALNRVVHARAPHDGVFVTAVMGQLNPRLGTLDYVSAGHPPPILLRPTVTGAPIGDPVLGVDPTLEFTVRHLDLPDEWAVLLVTDGLFEGQLPGRNGPHGDYYDFLNHLLDTSNSDIDSPTWLNDLADTLETANGGPLSDDAAALLLTPRSTPHPQREAEPTPANPSGL